MLSAKANGPVVADWPDEGRQAADQANRATEDDLLDSTIDEELLKAIPNLDAGRRSSATAEAMAA
eukprot:1285976-Karenia_brevis.AAC.1